jgi:hypothetical protein
MRHRFHICIDCGEKFVCPYVNQCSFDECFEYEPKKRCVRCQKENEPYNSVRVAIGRPV